MEQNTVGEEFSVPITDEMYATVRRKSPLHVQTKRRVWPVVPKSDPSNVSSTFTNKLNRVGDLNMS